jgi:hypothetical protein
VNKERSIQFATYEGYEIHAVPYQLADTGEWTVNIRIFHDCGYEMRSREYFSANSFKGRDEAVACCLSFGKQVIEGKIENCTLDGLW